MEREINKMCHFMEQPLVETSRLRPFHIRLARRIPNMLVTLNGRVKNTFYRKVARVETILDNLTDLGPGDWVAVRPFREIAPTLDKSGKYKGLYFMPEMKKFCGRKFRIFKKASKIKLESNGQLRTLKSPAFFLEGVYCDGKSQGGCDRSCFHFWRDAWLKRTAECPE